MAELEQIEGTVEDIIYENPDNGYSVFEVSGGGVITVVCGVVGELHAGESVVCRGRYENHATYGRQFHAQECETDMPKDLEAVYAFLASRSLPYIGAKTADKIIVGIIIHTNRNTQSLLSFTVSIKKVVHSYFLIFSRYHRYTRKVPIFFRNNQTLDLISKYIRKNFLPNSVTFKIIDTQHNCILLPA